jgi:hypothetical protein
MHTYVYIEDYFYSHIIIRGVDLGLQHVGTHAFNQDIALSLRGKILLTVLHASKFDQYY